MNHSWHVINGIDVVLNKNCKFFKRVNICEEEWPVPRICSKNGCRCRIELGETEVVEDI